jgi:uncharacterized lipoprotein YajG
MKKMLFLLAAVSVVFLAGCATPFPHGVISSDLKVPVIATGNLAKTSVPDLKIGKAQCQSIMGFIASGDASVKAACEDGKITKVYYVDWKVKSEIPLGIKTTYTTIVYGE